jgi:PAS domain S-box-containing protein
LFLTGLLSWKFMLKESMGQDNYAEQLKRVNRALRVRSEIAQLIIRATNEIELLQQSCDIIVSIGGYRLAWVGYAELDTSGKRIIPVAQSGFEAGYLETLNLTWDEASPRGRGPGGTAIRTRQPAMARNILHDPNFAPWREQAIQRGYASNIALPIIIEGQPIGEFSIYASEPNSYDAEEVELLNGFVKDMAYGLAHLRTKIQRDKAEEELRQSEERFRLLVEGALDYAMVLLDTDGHVTSWNIGAERLKGYRAEEIIGQSFARFYNQADIDAGKPERNLRLATLNGNLILEDWRVRKDGTCYYAEISYSALRDATSRLRGFSVIIRNITERVQAYQNLEQQVKERTGELNTLLEISRIVTSTLDMSATLDMQKLAQLVLAAIKSLFNYDGADLFYYDMDELQLLERHIPSSNWMPPYLEDRIGNLSFLAKAVLNSGPLLIYDIQASSDYQEFIHLMGDEAVNVDFQYLRSFLGLPLYIKGNPIGILNLLHHQPGYFNERHLEIGQSVANHIAVAFENARLHAQAQKAAVLEERQRLARELHDSVTQLLYSISLSVNTARTLYKRHEVEKVSQQLEDILALAKAGLAEMRALLFELRPESLANEGLVVALTKMAAALQARHELKVETTIPEEPTVPLMLKEAYYRVTQEALNNIAKHAHATLVKISLELKDNLLLLEIADNGIGFDIQASYPGHLGLATMRERAKNINATLEIKSTPSVGTTLRLCCFLN